MWGISSAAEESFDLESIRTLDGQVYEEILILSGDESGLMFRHRRGIAKIPFRQLSMNLRMLYEPVADVAAGTSDVAVDEATSNEEEESVAVELLVPAVVQTSTRVEVSMEWLRGALAQMPRRQMAPWPSHWSSFHPAHALAYPEYRELAVRDFLYTTGLAPRPCGIHPRPISRVGVRIF